MALYGQDAEITLLGALAQHLDDRRLIDVGAEHGSMTAELLKAGIEEAHVFEPQLDNVTALRARFAANPRVIIHDHAVSDADGTGELYLSTSPDGTLLPFSHSLLSRHNARDIEWKSGGTVTRRSLDSLVAAKEIPQRVGIVKIDTEGHDLAVVQGMGALDADVVMVEHWTDLPHTLGPCPWTASEMREALCGRGYAHFACIVHRGEFITLKWDDGEIEEGYMGNLVFLHDRALDRLLAVVLSCAGQLAENAVRVGLTYMRAANERLAIVEELKRAADARLKALEEVTATLRQKERESLSHPRRD